MIKLDPKMSTIDEDHRRLIASVSHGSSQNSSSHGSHYLKNDISNSLYDNSTPKNNNSYLQSDNSSFKNENNYSLNRVL